MMIAITKGDEHERIPNARYRKQWGVCHVTISNPPVNVMTTALYQDLVAVTEELASDESIKVVVFQSADPTSLSLTLT